MSTHSHAQFIDRCDLRGWYTPEEAAQVLGVQPETVRGWCRTGRIARTKLPGPKGRWRVSAEQVHELLAAGTP